MKYDYLVKKNHKTKFMISENEKSLLSTNEDYKIFIDKKLSKKINSSTDNNFLYKEISEISDSSETVNNIKNTTDDDLLSKKISEISESSKKVNNSKTKDASDIIFESEINTVEILVKYSSNIYNIFIKLIFLIINLITNTVVKIPNNYSLNINNSDKNDNKIINKINELPKDKNNKKSNSKKSNNKKNNSKKRYKNKKLKNIKEINSYFMDLD
jgi:hypothetical protein